jgi:oligopeptidase B
MPLFRRLLAAFGVAALMPLAAQTSQPPVAPVKEHREVRHGETVIDNYFWLRQKSDPEVVRYLQAEDAYTAEQTHALKPFEEALYTEMLSHIRQTDMGVPVRRGAYLYYARTEEGKQYPIQCRRKGMMDAPEEVLLDANALGKPSTSSSASAISWSATTSNLLAYTIDYTGFRQYALQVKDLRDGRTLPDTTERVTSVAWAADNRTLFLTTEDAVTKRSDKLWRHALGERAFDAALRREGRALRYRPRRRRATGGTWFLAIEAKDTSECRFLRADEPGGAFPVFLPRESKHRYYMDHREGLFYIRTNRAATISPS